MKLRWTYNNAGNGKLYNGVMNLTEYSNLTKSLQNTPSTRSSQSHSRTHYACEAHKVTPQHISYDAGASTGCVSSHPRAPDAQTVADIVHRDVSVTETRSFGS